MKPSHPAADPDRRFAEAFASIRRYLETTYGIRVAWAPIPAGFYGDLNGAEIRIAENLGAEDELFMLLHLFGHTVQWNLQGILDLDPAAGPLTEEAIATVLRYEREACAYSAGSVRRVRPRGIWSLPPIFRLLPAIPRLREWRGRSRPPHFSFAPPRFLSAPSRSGLRKTRGREVGTKGSDRKMAGSDVGNDGGDSGVRGKEQKIRGRAQKIAGAERTKARRSGIFGGRRRGTG